ncbi:MAG: hypothetical protein WBQ94_04465 [Terracidiphilus sp.]
MGNPTTPGGPGGPKSPWPEDSGSDQDFGATGVFGTVKAPEPVRESSKSEPEPDLLAKWAAEPPKPQPVPQPPAPTPVAEPVVHKVVFGGGAAASSPELLDRMRMASVERPQAVDAAPAPASGGKGSGGFTELLRTLGSESPAPPAKEPPKPVPPRPAADSGFTSLLRTLSTPETSAAPVAPPATPPSAPTPAPASGGFTELLRATPIANPAPMASPAPMFTTKIGIPKALSSGGAVPATPQPAGSQPGAFTQLFGAFGGAGAAASAPPPEVSTSAAPPSASAGSFTQMLSLDQRSAPVEPVYREERKPSAGGLDYGVPPVAPSPAEMSRDPFSSPPPPLESTPPGSGVGITRLIQMLDQPSTQPASRMEPAPMSSPRGPELGVWTQTFATLATPSEPVAQPAKAPEWTSPPVPPAPPAYSVSREPQYPAFPSPPVSSSPPAVPASSGPSEFTRILDASRMRELAMRGGAGAESLAPPPPQQNLPPAPQFAPPPPPAVPPPMPQFPQAPPQPHAMQGMGGMPQPGGFPPPPAYPVQFGAHPGAMPQPPGGMPHQPGMFAPAPPPPLPQAPPVKPVAPPMGKLQQLVPVLLVVIIVLLVAILVTVFFLMKH